MSQPQPHDPPSPAPFTIFSTMRYDISLPSPPLYMPELHRARLLASAAEFRFDAAHQLLSAPDFPQTLEKAVAEHVAEKYPTSVSASGADKGDDGPETTPEPGPLRIRIDISTEGTMSITSGPTAPLPLAALYPTSLPPLPQPSDPSDPSSTSTPPPTPPFPSTWTLTLHPLPTPTSAHTAHKTSLRALYDGARNGCPLTHEVLLQTDSGEISEGTLATPYFWREGGWVTPRVEAGGNRGTTRRWALERGLAREGRVEVGSVREGEAVWVSNGLRGWGWGVVALGKGVGGS